MFPTHVVVGSNPAKLKKLFREFNGERGIRTLGIKNLYDALAMRYLKPLGHLSLFLVFFQIIQKSISDEYLKSKSY